MAGEWREMAVEEFAEVVGGGTPSTADERNFGGDIPWITPKDLSNYGFRYIERGERNITEKGLLESNATLLPAGSVLLSTRAPVGYLAIAKNPLTTNQGFKSLVVREGFDNEFVFYLLKANVDYLKSQASGTTFGELSGSTLRKLKFLIPPLPEQRAIAAVLGALDDKIELNRRMNRTLEAIAQAVFRHWFVENEEAEGWEIRTLGDICEFAYGKGLKEEERVSGPIPVYGSNGQIGWHNEPLVKGPGIVVGRKGNPGIVTWVHTDFFPIDTTFYVEIKDKETSLYWLYYMLVSLNLSNLAADSAVPGLNRNFAYMSELVYPPTDLMKKFDDVIKPLFAKIHANEQQSRTLAALRDALLPKLLRGEVRVTVHE
jgi:type I restriction enzyme S subunit